jgi:hypothetical protein
MTLQCSKQQKAQAREKAVLRRVKIQRLHSHAPDLMTGSSEQSAAVQGGLDGMHYWLKNKVQLIGINCK